MGDGKVKKYAVILNGYKETWALKNVELSAAVLKRGGYKVHIASPERPRASVDKYVASNEEDAGDMIDGIKSDDDDEVVFYITGHGQNGKEVCLGDVCVRDEVIKKLDALKFGRRTVITDVCYGGNLAPFFTDNPRTLFVSAGPKGKVVYGNNFSFTFWKGARELRKMGYDLNADGAISWQERFAAAVYVDEQINLTPVKIFARSKGYHDYDVETGRRIKTRFSPRVTVVSNFRQVEAKIGKLKRGEYAVIAFSRPACGKCSAYKPKFLNFARKSNGKYLLLSAQSPTERLLKAYDVKSVPAVRIVDAKGRFYKADVNSLFKSLASLGKGSPHFLSALLARFKTVNRKARLAVLKRLAEMDSDTKGLVPILTACLRDRSASVRWKALSALKKLGFRIFTPLGKLFYVLSSPFKVSAGDQRLIAEALLKQQRKPPDTDIADNDDDAEEFVF